MNTYKKLSDLPESWLTESLLQNCLIAHGALAVVEMEICRSNAWWRCHLLNIASAAWFRFAAELEDIHRRYRPTI